MSDLRRRNRIDMVVTINVDIFPLKVVLEHQSTGTVQPHTSILGKLDFSFLRKVKVRVPRSDYKVQSQITDLQFLIEWLLRELKMDPFGQLFLS